jgi:hypothetical protein
MRGQCHLIRFCLGLPAVVGIHLSHAVDAAAHISTSPPPPNYCIIRAHIINREQSLGDYKGQKFFATLL